MAVVKQFIFLVAFCYARFLYYSAPYGMVKLAFVDVDQGDAIYMQTVNGKKIIVDGGPNFEVDAYVSKHFLTTDCTIDLLILSHPHFDHLAGLIRVLERCVVSAVVYNQTQYESKEYADFKTAIKGVKAIVPKQGDLLTVDGVVLKVVSVGLQNDSNLNNASLVLLVKSGTYEVLLTGDLEFAGLKEIDSLELTKYIAGELEVYKAAHHGSRNGLYMPLVDQLDLQTCVISLGKNNKYGHPSPDVINYFNSRKCKIFRTDLFGSIEFLFE